MEAIAVIVLVGAGLLWLMRLTGEPSRPCKTPGCKGSTVHVDGLCDNCFELDGHL